jgi:hypothetical protein
MTIVERYTKDPMRRVPEHLREGLRRYILYGTPPGHFLMAVLEHELFESFNRADDASRAGLYDLVCYLYNEAPSGCHGDKGAVGYWIAQHGLVGRDGLPLP